MKTNECYILKILCMLQVLKLPIGLGISLPIIAKSYYLPRSFLAPFKIHQDQRVPPGMAALGKAKREETHWP